MRRSAAALGLEDRAGGVQQPPARAPAAATARAAFRPGRGPARPRRRAGAASARRGGGARCRWRCRGRPAGWRRRAGRPTSRAGRVRRPALERGAQLQAVQRVLHARQAHGVAVQRQQVQVGQFQQVGVLPPGAAQASSTRAPSAGAVRRAAAARRAGRRRPAPRPRLRQSRAVAAPGRAGPAPPPGRPGPGRPAAWRREALGGQPLHVGRAGAAAGVHAQRHRRALVGGGQQGLPGLRPVVLDALYPPQRVVVGAQRRACTACTSQRVALTQEAAQHGVDEAAAAGMRRWARSRPGPPACARRRGRPARSVGHSSASAVTSSASTLGGGGLGTRRARASVALPSQRSTCESSAPARRAQRRPARAPARR
jgi:hypothetical protein